MQYPDELKKQASQKKKKSEIVYMALFLELTQLYLSVQHRQSLKSHSDSCGQQVATNALHFYENISKMYCTSLPPGTGNIRGPENFNVVNTALKYQQHLQENLCIWNTSRSRLEL